MTMEILLIELEVNYFVHLWGKGVPSLIKNTNNVANFIYNIKNKI